MSQKSQPEVIYITNHIVGKVYEISKKSVDILVDELETAHQYIMYLEQRVKDLEYDAEIANGLSGDT